jgi:hypothetical protein
MSPVTKADGQSKTRIRDHMDEVEGFADLRHPLIRLW